MQLSGQSDLIQSNISVTAIRGRHLSSTLLSWTPLLHGPGHFVEMGSMCPAVTLHCRQTWAADLFKPLHCIMMADQHAVVWRGCCSMEQGTLGRWAACVLL